MRSILLTVRSAMRGSSRAGCSRAGGEAVPAGAHSYELYERSLHLLHSIIPRAQAGYHMYGRFFSRIVETFARKRPGHVAWPGRSARVCSMLERVALRNPGNQRGVPPVVPPLWRPFIPGRHKGDTTEYVSVTAPRQ